MERKRLEQHKRPGRSLETVDPETGEVLKGAFVFIPEKHKSPFGRDWFAMAQDALTFLARNRKVLGEEGFAVFCALAGKLDFENYILVAQAEMARDLGMKPPNFSRAVQRLECLGIIERGPKSGRSPTFKLNPRVGWKGRAREHFGALQKARARGWDLVEGGNQLDLPL